MAFASSQHVTQHSIKVVACDMDGTFFRDNKTFDEPRFRNILKRMQDKHCEFVIASGNQYIQLIRSFSDYCDSISYVAENGSYIVDKGEHIYSAHLSREVVESMYHALINDEGLYTMLCGVKATYVQKNQATDEFISLIKYYFPSLVIVDNLLEVDDEILKYCVTMQPDQTMYYYDKLVQTLPKEVTPTPSGFGSIDIIQAGVNKAFGLDMLVKRWGYTPDDCIAFGDAGNDIEMLKYVGCGYAMANSMPGVLEVADKQAPSNNDDGVLQVLDTLF